MEKENFIKQAKIQWRKKIWNDMSEYWTEILTLRPDMLEKDNIPVIFNLLDKYKTKLLHVDIPVITEWSITYSRSISGKINNHYNIEKHSNGGLITTSIGKTYTKIGDDLYLTTITDSIYKLENPYDRKINLNLFFEENKI